MNRCKTCLMPASGDECESCIEYRNREKVDWKARRKVLEDLIDDNDQTAAVITNCEADGFYTCIRLKELGASVTAIIPRPPLLTEAGRENYNALANHVSVVELASPSNFVFCEMRKSLERKGDLLGPIFGYFLREGIAAAKGLDFDLVFSTLNVKKSRIPVYHLKDFEPWSSRLNYEYAKNYGFRGKSPTLANWWDFSAINNPLIGLDDHIQYRQTGIGRGCRQISHDIREGYITREAAYKFVRDRDGKFPWRYGGVGINDVLRHMNMSSNSLFEVLERFTSKELFHKDEKDCRPILKEFPNES